MPCTIHETINKNLWRVNVDKADASVFRLVKAIEDKTESKVAQIVVYCEMGQSCLLVRFKGDSEASKMKIIDILRMKSL
jgi:hypothetical protein